MLRGPLLVLILGAASCAPATDPPASLLLLTLDTTDPGALGCYGGPPGLTPHLDRLAREGLVFDTARSVAPLTLPAHASLLTGLYPPRHSVRRNGDSVLPGEAVTLAERLPGHQSAAFVAAVVLDPDFGLSQGFELYDAPPTPEDVDEHLAASRPADEIAARACAWLRARDQDRPFLLWLHFYDPHFPYRPAQEFRQRAGGDAYLGEIAAMDAAIGRVLAELERQDLLERTLVAAVADHGEGRGRHGEETHGAFVFDSTLRIPLIVRLPGGERAGERCAAPVSLVDLHVLLGARLGLAPAADSDGRDPLAGEAGPGSYFESYFGTISFGWSPLAGWADAQGKYVHSSAPEYFDLASDPHEDRNALAEQPEAVARARARMAELCARPRLARSELAPSALNLQQEIERLGYAGGSPEESSPEPEPLAASTLPSPHRMLQAYVDYMQARKLLEEQGSRAEARELLQRALAANPGNHKAWFFLGLCSQELGRFDEAAAAFGECLEAPGGERIPAQLNLAVCLHNLGQRECALALLDQALAGTDGPPGALELWIQLLEESGRGDDAARARGRLRARP
jgi:arylsulfatase A-like enzyme